jgi:hypothetical protein
MDGKEFYIYAKPCNENGITIYPKGCNNGKYKIIINKNGREKIGVEIYEDKEYIKQETILTPRGPQKIKVQVPSVWDKILDLYKQTCKRNHLL